MSNIDVRFLGKGYSIPSDVITYIGLVDFTNTIRDSLVSSFSRQIRSGVEIMESDSFMLDALNEQTSKYVRKLLEHDIYDKTANDYIKGNKGYSLFLDTKKKIVSQIISIRKEKLEAYRSGVQDAIYKKDASVTGLDFGIISGSFVNHMIYAYMDASEQTKQEQKALKEYNREIATLEESLKVYDKQEAAYLANNAVPAMNTVFTFFAYELLDAFVSDLIKAGKFDKAALNYINLERSNDLLKNLNLANNKQAVIESAFTACPFNTAVYMNAMKYDCLDYDSFQTAKVFKQDHHVLSFLKESWGEVSFPTKFNINYHCINVWASITGKSATDLLRGLTEQYATGIVKAYSRVAGIIADKSRCVSIIGELRDDVVLSGDSICTGKAREYVDSIVPITIWVQIMEQCGHSNLLDQIKKCFSTEEELHNKKDLDAYVLERLTLAFKEARQVVVVRIGERKQEEERQRIERERQKAAQEKQELERRKRNIKIAAIVTPIIAVGIVLFIILNTVIIPSNKYSQAISLQESGDYHAAIELYNSLGDYKDATE